MGAGTGEGFDGGVQEMALSRHASRIGCAAPYDGQVVGGNDEELCAAGGGNDHRSNGIRRRFQSIKYV